MSLAPPPLDLNLNAQDNVSAYVNRDMSFHVSLSACKHHIQYIVITRRLIKAECSNACKHSHYMENCSLISKWSCVFAPALTLRVSVLQASSQWRPSPCSLCSCSGGSVSCSALPCPAVDCPPHHRLYTPPGECCPQCVRNGGEDGTRATTAAP